MQTRSPLSIYATLLLGAILLTSFLFDTGPAAAGPGDAVLGRWMGEADTGQERIPVWLEIGRDERGLLTTRLTRPISNQFDVDAGESAIEDGRLVNPRLRLSLAIGGDRLVGSIAGAAGDVTFGRVDDVPRPTGPPALPTGPEPRWHTRVGGQVFASPVVVGSRVFVGSTAGLLHAIDGNDGRVLWAFATGSPIHGAVAADAESVYVMADSGVLSRVSAATGALDWQVPLGGGDAGRVLPDPTVFDWDWQGATPLLVDGVVYVGTADGNFHAVDADDGSRRWRFASGGRIRAGAALDADNVVFGSEDHHVYALDRRNGREVWRFDSGAPVDATPVVHDRSVLIGNRGYGLYSLDADTGIERWKQSFWGSWVESTPVVVDGVIYIGSSDLRRVSAIDPVDGRVIWRTDVFGWSWGTPLVIGDRIHVGAAGGAPYFIEHVASLSTLDRKTGRLLSRRPLSDSGGHQWGIAGSPVPVAGGIVVATIEGAVLGFPVD